VDIKDLHLPTITISDIPTELTRYVYFHFSPTLVYRDSYPRINAASIRWSKVIYLFLNCFGSFIYTLVIFKTFCIPYFRESWKEAWSITKFLVSLFRAMIPGTMLLVLTFFGVLHSWFNLFAELLRYGDRRFYEDWWNVSSWAGYYRKWNLVVHEWLHTYVYQDLIRFTKNRAPRLFAFVFVFIFSAIIHELIIATSFKFFYPVLLFMFGGPGVIFITMTKSDRRSLNVFFWAMMFIGNGILMIMYSWEFYARETYDLSD
jgi:sterol O-acyltransferase